MFDRLLFTSLPALFSFTLFVSAGLLFTVELMIAKMILPLLGGTPSVWNTCMMFFQVMLLAGYGYAHLSGTKAALSRQIILHLSILALACFVLPVAIPRQWAPSVESNPIGGVLLLLLIAIGPPFFVLSATAPLLQRWFARTGHPSAGDPYFLYSASNLGSMLALISYPIWIEPHFRLIQQSRSWSAGYVVLLVLTVLCAAATKKYRAVCPPDGTDAAGNASEICNGQDPPPALRERGRWVLFAFVPSSLMLGVTTFLSTDVAAIPLFWVVPLALYLLSFIIVFARVPTWVHNVSVRLFPFSITALIVMHFSDIGVPKGTSFALHLTNFFLCCMVCHGEIARTRPAAQHLTAFYLLLSFGGMLGGVFNSLMAPLVFTTVFEYPLLLMLSALLLPVGFKRINIFSKPWIDAALYLAVPAAMALLTYGSAELWNKVGEGLSLLADMLRIQPQTLGLTVSYGLLVLVCCALVHLRKPYLFGMAVMAMLLTFVVSKDLRHDIVHRERSFFGVLTVTKDADGAFMNLSHGTTLHGKQWLDPSRRPEPVSYYHRNGPVGEVFSEYSGAKIKTRIAVTGLGTGSLAAYAGKGQEIDFYEIDPAVKRISTHPDYFSFLSECRAKWRVILGDARLTMEKAPAHHYDMIILDAFSSDSIPVHLLTKEAINLYFSKLSQKGVLLIHITNRYVNLAPVLAKLADEMGFADRFRDDDGDSETGKDGSTWVLLARSEKDLDGLSAGSHWQRIEPRNTVAAWTDDFSNILSVFKW